MNIKRIVDCAERITCGCEDQVSKDYAKIKKVLNTVEESSYYKKYNLKFSYIMEHESIFDDLIAINDLAVKDRYHWRLPHEYLESLGYTKNTLEKDENGYETIMWKHDNLPTLKEHCYVWKVEDFDNYSKTSHTLSTLCKRIGCEVPEKYNEKYYENRFKIDIEFLEERKQHDGDLEYLFKRSRDRDEYSFLRFSEYGLFRGYDSTLRCGGYLLCSLGPDDAHMKLEYMKEVIEVALLYDAMYMLQMTWGNTNYYRQDIDYSLHVRFLEKCLSLAKEKYEEDKEEYDDDSE